VRRLSGAGLAALRRLYTARLGELVAEPLAAADVLEARRSHDLLVPWLLERKPRAFGALAR
jgi:hypothetical protein